MKLILSILIFGSLVLTSCLEDRVFPTEKKDAPIDTSTAFTLVINEIMPSVQPDWVEFYNWGNKALLLKAGKVFISGSKDNLLTFAIPSDITVPSKSYLMFECRTGGTPTSSDVLFSGDFSLSKSGEFVSLAYQDENNNLIVADSISFPAIPDGQTYSRTPVLYCYAAALLLVSLHDSCYWEK